MPSKSKAQHNLMAAAAHNPAFAKKVGIPMSVAKDFNQADKGKKFKEGGMMDKEDLAQDKKVVKKAVKMHDDQLHGGKKTDLAKLKKGGMCKGYKKGGIIEKGTGEKYASKAAMMKHEKKESKAEEAKEMGMKKGGSCGMKKYARGGGIEVRGKTKGRII
jgi:hypothetical protein